MKFETERLILRPFEYKDVDDFYAYACRPDVGPLADWAPHETKYDTRDIIEMLKNDSKKNGSWNLAIVLKESNVMIGSIEFFDIVPHHKAEIGFSLNPYYQHKGYATEAVMKMCFEGFKKLKLERIYCLTFVDNYKSQEVAVRCGFKEEGILRKYHKTYKGNIVDVKVFSILKEEFNYES